MLIGTISSVSLTQFNAHEEQLPLDKITKPAIANSKVPLDKIRRLTIVSPDNLYLLILNQQDCQTISKLIRAHLGNDLNSLYQFRKQNLLTMSNTQNKIILESSINCLRFILMSAGGLSFIDVSKVIRDSFLHTSNTQFTNFVYQLLNLLEIL